VRLLGDAGAEILAFSGFPNELWSERYSKDRLERQGDWPPHDVISIFPDDDSLTSSPSRSVRTAAG
jgi:hypothetical protein